MKTTLHTTSPSQLDTECLVVAVSTTRLRTQQRRQIRKARSQTPHRRQSRTQCRGRPHRLRRGHGQDAGDDASAQAATAEGQAADAHWRRQGKKFSSAEVRKLAGAAVRALKAKGVKSFALVMPAALTMPRRSSSKARSSATSSPTTTRAIARQKIDRAGHRRSQGRVTSNR
jgi:hypothetical protein